MSLAPVGCFVRLGVLEDEAGERAAQGAFERAGAERLEQVLLAAHFERRLADAVGVVGRGGC